MTTAVPPTTPTRQELRRAHFQDVVLQGDVQTAQKMLSEGFDVDSILPKKVTALYLAITGDAAMVHLLLYAGADVNWTGEKDETPLLRAVDCNRPEIVKALLDAGAKPDGGPSKAPLWAAVNRNDVLSVERLIRAGADLHLANKYGTTLLHRAVSCSYLEVTRRLLEAGLCINIKDLEGQTPIFYAQSMEPSFGDILRDHKVDVHATDNNGDTALFVAAQYARKSLFDGLVNLGANPHKRSPNGTSLFDAALVEKQGDMALHILRNVPELTPEGHALNNALVRAVLSGSTALVQHLVDLGADLTQRPGGRALTQLIPRKDEAMKQLLRALKTGVAIGKAIPLASEHQSSNGRRPSKSLAL